MSVSEEIEKLQEEFFKKEGKNSFFKKSQKIECAKTISSYFNLDDLLGKTIFVVPETSNIYIEYPLLKMYANPDNYVYIIDYIITLYNYCIDLYGYFEIHINLKLFTISAAERYRNAIMDFSQRCLENNGQYSFKMKCMKIYNTPSMMESISKFLKPFLDPVIVEKIVMYSKEESQTLLDNLIVLEK